MSRKKARYAPKSRKRRKGSRLRSFIVTVMLCAALLLGAKCLLNCRPTLNHDKASSGSLLHVITADTLPETIVNYTGMTVSFNPDLHIPNWVAWELTREKAHGTIPRAKDFVHDPEVRGCAYPADYKSSGYDRGHMAPAGDMKWDVQAMAESFSMVNIVPQNRKLNSGVWKNIEEKCRARVERDSAIIIICGPVTTDIPVEHIGETRVAVPQRFFKVILSPFTTPPSAIGFIVDNAANPGGMEKTAVSVDEVEAITGHDFFSNLPDSVENSIESVFNFQRWSRLH